jgi:hypothetical protein
VTEPAATFLGLDNTSTSDTPSAFRSGRHETKINALTKRIRAAAQCHTEALIEAGEGFYCALVMLTYASELDHARDITEFLKRLRQWLKRRRLVMRYVWVREIGQNDRPHYHVLLWLPEGVTIPKPDDVGWWPHGFSGVQRAIEVAKVVSYMVKGATKCAKVYRGRRLFGCGGIHAAWQRKFRWLCLPRYAQEVLAEGCDPHRASGGGVVDRDTGEIVPSQYVCVYQGKGKPWQFVPRATQNRTAP